MENTIGNTGQTYGVEMDLIEKIEGLENMPPLLREIHNPPKRLWVRGKIFSGNSASAKFLCVVGSRRNTNYGKMACESLIAGLAGQNIVIVSGLALGIDSIAHEAAIDAGLRTIAVPGSGLSWEKIYPAIHHNLARRILENDGAMVSPFKPDFQAAPYGFPLRNRIMAGMSHAVLIIEASLRSGTLITAKLASEYNRDVGIVPGRIFDSRSAGPHLFLRIGATLIRNSSDILEMLGLPRVDEKNPNQPNIDGAKTGGTKNLFQAHILDSFSPEEKKIMEALFEPLTKDELIRRTGLRATEANIALSMLEMKNLVKNDSGIIALT